MPLLGTQLLLCCVLWAWETGSESPFPVVVEQMKANDQKYDESILRYRRRKEVENKYVMPIGMSAEEIKNSRRVNTEPILVYNTLESLSVWGQELSFLRRADLDAKEGKQRPELFQQWGNLGGKVEEIFDVPNPDSPKSGRFVERNTTPAAMARLQEQRMEVEMGLGIGFARRIKKVDSITPNGDGGVTLKGQFSIWGEDLGAGTLVIDAKSVVRKATIQPVINGHYYLVEVSTEGNAETTELAMAKTGSYRCQWLYMVKDGEKRQINQSRGNSQFTFVDLKKYKNRDEFLGASEIVVPTNSFIADMDAKEKRVKQADGSESVLRKIVPATAPLPPSNSFYLWLILVHGVLFTTVALILWLRYRQRQRTAT